MRLLLTRDDIRAGVALACLALAAAAAAEAQQAQQQPTQTPPRQQQQRPAQRPAQQQQQQQQQQAQQPPPPQRVEGFASGWARICQPIPGSEQQGCIVTQEVFGEAGAFMASVAMQEPRGEQRRQLIVIVPLGVSVQSGVLMRVDGNVAIPAKIGTCLQNGCFAGVDLGEDLLRPMRGGQTLFITVRPSQGPALDLAVPLAGFAQSVDGQPLSAEVLQERQRRFQDEIVRRQEEFRRRVQEQQQGTAPPGGGAAPAQPATPPASPPAQAPRR
jgi:invasion protein IalB